MKAPENVTFNETAAALFGGRAETATTTQAAAPAAERFDGSAIQRHEAIQRKIAATYTLEAVGVDVDDLHGNDGMLIDAVFPPPATMPFGRLDDLKTALFDDLPDLLLHSREDLGYRITQNGYAVGVAPGSRWDAFCGDPEAIVQRWTKGQDLESPHTGPLGISVESKESRDKINLLLEASQGKEGSFQLRSNAAGALGYDWTVVKLGMFTARAVYYDGLCTVRVGIYPPARPPVEEKLYYDQSTLAQFTARAAHLDLPLGPPLERLQRILATPYVGAGAIRSAIASRDFLYPAIEPVLRDQPDGTEKFLDMWVAAQDMQDRGDLVIPVVTADLLFDPGNTTGIKRVTALHRYLRLNPAYRSIVLPGNARFEKTHSLTVPYRLMFPSWVDGADARTVGEQAS